MGPTHLILTCPLVCDRNELLPRALGDAAGAALHGVGPRAGGGGVAAFRPLNGSAMPARDAPADPSGGQPNLKYLVLGGSPHEEEVC